MPRWFNSFNIGTTYSQITSRSEGLRVLIYNLRDNGERIAVASWPVMTGVDVTEPYQLHGCFFSMYMAFSY